MIIERFQTFIKGIFIFLLVSVIAYLILGECLLPADKLGAKDDAKKYTGEWERVFDDGSRIPVQIPNKFKAERNETVTIETKLPDDMINGTYLCFRSAKQDLKIYVDGKLRQEYSTKNTRLFGKTSAVAYVFFEINQTDAGKVLRMETKTDSSYTGIFYTVYTGSQLEIWQYYLKNYGAELAIAFIMLILSIISIIGSIALSRYYHRKLDLEYLGWGILIAGMWLFSNSVFRQLIFPNLTVINDIAFFMVMLLPMPYMIYINNVQKNRYQKIYNIIGMITIADFVLCTVLHITELCDFTDTIILMTIVCLLSILFMAATIITDIFKGNIKSYRFVSIGILCAFISAIIQIVIYFNKTNLFNGVTLAIGLLFLLIFAVINTIYEVINMEFEKQQALFASEAKGRFLANMSHEIRTPINAVLGMDEMILRESSEPQIKEYALDIQNAGQNLLSLINDILDLSKIESGKMEIIPVEYDFSSLIHDIINMISMKAQDKELEVKLLIDEKLPSKLYGDDVRIRQILINLMTNAVKYTKEGHISLDVSGMVNDDSVILKFAVEDTGIGIKEEDLGKLFNEFERIEEQKNRNIEGTGLGINIVAQLLSLMGSRLKVESTYGKGSKFYFELEQEIIDDEPIGNLEERISSIAKDYSYQVAFTAKDADILVVDDNAVNRKVFLSLLKATKVNIDEADSGKECLQKVAQKHYDIIFLDHMMPDLDGIATLHRMREMDESLCESVPVIVLTANAVSGAKEMYLSEGFTGFLSKPINPEKLEALIMEYLPKDKITVGGVSEEKDINSNEVSDGNLPDVEGIEWDFAMLYINDIVLLKKVIHEFCCLAEKDAEKLYSLWKDLSSLEESDMEIDEAYRQYRVKVHSMKSSAAMIGAVSLSGVARMLEYAARDKKIDLIKALTTPFLDEWREMKDRLSVQFEENEVKEKKDADYKLIIDYLRLLKNFMEDMDIDTADEIITHMKQFRYPDNIEPLVEELGTAVVNIDVEQTTEISDILIEKFNKYL